MSSLLDFRIAWTRNGVEGGRIGRERPVLTMFGTRVEIACLARGDAINVRICLTSFLCRRYTPHEVYVFIRRAFALCPNRINRFTKEGIVDSNPPLMLSYNRGRTWWMKEEAFSIFDLSKILPFLSRDIIIQKEHDLLLVNQILPFLEERLSKIRKYSNGKK